MNYLKSEADVITADSFGELNYRQKKLFLAAQKEENADRGKYASALIKTCGEGVYNNLKGKFGDGNYRSKVFEELAKKDVVCVTVKSPSYPAALAAIPAPPLVLYCRGNVNLLKDDMFAVVGSRRTSVQMLEECKKISAKLAEVFTVVTGVADGADSAAAKGALASGKLICVLPGGHSSPCASDMKLLRTVENEALTISEFPPHIPAQRYTFILRNRIMAGLVKGVLVVSAAKKSGALSTASYAADYGRDVFAFPYGIGITSGEGCNNLIKKGASLCGGAEDIFSAFGIICEEREQSSLEPEEKEVVDLLKEQGELHIEVIARTLGKNLPDLSAVCSMLEIKGLIIKTGGNKYAAI